MLYSYKIGISLHELKTPGNDSSRALKVKCQLKPADHPEGTECNKALTQKSVAFSEVPVSELILLFDFYQTSCETGP